MSVTKGVTVSRNLNVNNRKEWPHLGKNWRDTYPALICFMVVLGAPVIPGCSMVENDSMVDDFPSGRIEKEERSIGASQMDTPESIINALQRSSVIRMSMRDRLANCLAELDASAHQMDVEKAVSVKIQESQVLKGQLENISAKWKEACDRATKAESKLITLEKNHSDAYFNLEEALKREREDHCKSRELAKVVAKEETRVATMAAAKSLKEAQDEATKKAAEAREANSKASALKIEANELHGAILSIHAELRTVQRELEVMTEEKDKMGRDLKAAEMLVKQRQVEWEGLEKQAEEHEQWKVISEQNLEAIRMELKQAQAAALAEAALRTEQTNSLSKRFQETSSKLASSESQRTSLKKETESLGERLEAIIVERDELHRAAGNQETRRMLEETLQAANARVSALGKELGRVRVNYEAQLEARTEAERNEKAAKDLIEAIGTELKELKAEKHALLDALQRNGRKIKELEENAQVEAKQKEAREAMAKISESKAVIKLREINDRLAKTEELLEAEKVKENELRNRTEALKIELDSAREGAKARDRESAQRIVELSQGNARLAAECSSYHKESQNLEEQTADLKQRYDQLEHTLEESCIESKRLMEAIQQREEDVEVIATQRDAIEGKLYASIAQAQRMKDDAKLDMNRIQEEYKNSMNGLKISLQEEADRKYKELEGQLDRIQTERDAEFSRMKEIHSFDVQEIRDQLQQDVAQFRQKNKALATALEVAQHDVQEHIQANAVLKKHLSEALEAKPPTVQSSSSVTNQPLQSSPSRLNHRDKLAVDAEVASLKRLLEAATQAKVSAAGALAQAQAEIESKGQELLQMKSTLAEKESDTMRALQEADAAKEQVELLEQTVSQERVRYTAAMASDQAEIERLKRRDVVISEAMSRLADGSDEECVSKWSPSRHSPSRIRALGLAVSPGQPRANKIHLQDKDANDSSIDVVENPPGQQSMPNSVNTTALDVQKHIDAALKERAERKKLRGHEHHRRPELQKNPERLETEVIDISRPLSAASGRNTHISKCLNHKPTQKPVRR